MKKSLVAVGVVAALGVVWTAGAWFTGKQMEARFADMIEQANAHLTSTAPEAGLKLSYENYQRGLFSSHVQLILQPAGSNGSPWLAPDQKVVFDERVDHGPFPLAQLKSFNLLPAMASVTSTLVNNELSKPLFDAAKGQSPFSALTRVGYSGATDTKIALQPLNYEADGEKIVLSAGTIEINATGDGKTLGLSGEMQSALIETLNEYNQHVQLSFTNLQSDGSSEMTEFAERIGAQKLSLDKLTLSIEGQQMGLLEGMKLDGASTLTEDRKSINTRLDYSVGSLKLQNHDMGSGRLSLKVDGLNGEAWHQFNQRYQAILRSFATSVDKGQDPDSINDQIGLALITLVPVLLKDNPSVTIAPVSWKNAKGEATFNFALQLADPSAEPAAPKSFDEILNNSTMDSKLVIPVAMARHLMTQVSQLEGHDPEYAASQAERKVDSFALMGQSYGLLTRDGDNIVSSAQFSNGKITLNGKTMTLEQAASLFLPAPSPERMRPQ